MPFRLFGKKRDGGEWTLQEKWAVFCKGQVAPGQDPNLIRADACNMRIHWSLYGDTAPLGMGWEIDHIRPVSKGGTDDLWNLQPLQWQNNRQKGDDETWTCAVTWRAA